MAFTRKGLASIDGLTPEQVDKIMNLHGTSMSDYQLKSEFASDVQAEVDKQTGELKKQLGNSDIEALKAKAAKADELEKDLSATKLNYQLETRLMKEGAINTKAVRALLDPAKIVIEGEKITGLDEQITALKESEKWAFTQPVVMQPAATGARQTAPAAQLSGVEAEFQKRNPDLKL